MNCSLTPSFKAFYIFIEHFLNHKSINKLKYVFTRGKAFNKTVPVLLKPELEELTDDDDDE